MQIKMTLTPICKRKKATKKPFCSSKTIKRYKSTTCSFENTAEKPHRYKLSEQNRVKIC